MASSTKSHLKLMRDNEIKCSPAKNQPANHFAFLHFEIECIMPTNLANHFFFLKVANRSRIKDGVACTYIRHTSHCIICLIRSLLRTKVGIKKFGIFILDGASLSFRKWKTVFVSKYSRRNLYVVLISTHQFLKQCLCILDTRIHKHQTLTQLHPVYQLHSFLEQAALLSYPCYFMAGLLQLILHGLLLKTVQKLLSGPVYSTMSSYGCSYVTSQM